MVDHFAPPGGPPWRDIIETAVDGISVLEPVLSEDGRIADFRCVYLNPAGSAVIERSVDDAVGRLATELSPGAAENGRIALYAAAYLGEPFWGELRHRSELVDRTVGVRASRHGDHLVIRFRDVTETAELRVSERQARRSLEMLVDAVRDAILAFDRDWRLTYVNEGACRMAARRADELIGVAAAEAFPELAGSELERRLLAVHESQNPADFETDYPAPSAAQPTRLQVRAYPEPVEGGLVVVLHDQGPRQAMQARIEQLQRLESITTLAGGLAHDFNNLLTVIGGHVSLLRTESGLPEAALEDLAAITEAVHRASRLTGQLLTFSRRQPVRPEAVDLAERVRALHPLVARLVTGQHEVVVVGSAARVTVLVDPSELDHALVSLVHNAVDATPGGGRVWLRSGVVWPTDENSGGGPGDEARRHLRDLHDADREGAAATTDAGVRERAERAGLEPGRYGFVQVADDGVGMVPEVVARAREPFFTTKPAGVGTGLGLSAVHGMVEQAGGWLAIDSEPGRGTTVTIYLPLASAEPSAATEPSASAEPGAVGPAATDRWAPVDPTDLDRVARNGHAPDQRTVMVVDDTTGVRELAVRTLEAAGYLVVSSDGGAEALAQLEEHGRPVDLLVTDVVMPGMGGAALADEARTRGLAASVLLMSGYTDEESARQAVSRHEVAFLAKPFSPDDLVDAVRRALS